MIHRTLALVCLLASLAATAHATIAPNLVPNPRFDDHVLAWTVPNPLSAKMAHSPLDERGKPDSGSLRLYDIAAGAFVATTSACFPIEGGKEIVYGGSAHGPGAEVPQPVRASLQMYDTPDCSGGSFSAWPNDTSASTGDVGWGSSQGSLFVAASKQSARLQFFLNAVPTPAVELFIDNAYAHQGIGCLATDTVACLNGGRFRLSIDWEVPEGTKGRARLRGFSELSDSAYATFFDESNVEIVVKVLNGCGVNERFWVFAAGLTNVATAVRVRDTHATKTWHHENDIGEEFLPVLDTDGFATCPH